MRLNGQTLGQYEIIEPIGAGGMATIYKAYQPGLDRHVAIKVPTQKTLNPELKERFIREAKAVARLSHPNILPIYDVGLEDDLSYFVMKYVPGGRTLQDLMGQPMDLSTVCHYIEQVATALDHAHERGILHRDIKPTNMLLENDWLLLADFGLAKIAIDSNNLTDAGAVMGTPNYLSPEQAESRPIDHRADIYSLGVVLYEMVLGHVPYEAESPLAILYKHINDPVPRPRRYRPDLPAGVEAVIIKALAKEPDKRYNRAGELAEALCAQLRSSPPGVPEIIRSTIPARIFVWHQHNVPTDRDLAGYLQNLLSQAGHVVFIDDTTQADDEWLAEIDPQIQSGDFLIVLLSKASIESQMAQDVIKQANEYRKSQKNPHILPVQVACPDQLPPSIETLLGQRHYLTWQSEADNEQVGREILAAIAKYLPSQRSISVVSRRILSEDGGTFTNEESLHTPLPQFDSSLLEALEAPGGVIKLRDKFYIERQGDTLLRREIVKAGTTTTIRASRQTGKSSLLVRGVSYARENGAKVVHLDLQRLDAERLATPDLFLRDLAELIVRKLRLDVAEVENLWRGSLGPQDKLTYLMEDYVLPEVDVPIILALDEVDRLLQTSFHSDFFALLRSWHNSRAFDEQWDRLNMVLVISTEPYLLIDDVNQSPFNVGLKIYLEDFDEDQVRDLNQRHSSPVSEIDFPQLLTLLGGQPYLTRQALYTLTVKHLTWADLTQTATLEHGPFGDHLRRQQWLLRDEPGLREAFKQIIEQEHCSDETARFRLLQAGLIKGSGDVYTCRCELYKLYFKDKL